MQLVLDSSGLQISRKAGTFVVERGKAKRIISPSKLTSIAVTSNIILHSNVIALAIQHQIPILFFDGIGKAVGRLWSPNFISISTLRRYQVKFSETPLAMNWMVDIFYLKTDGQKKNLEFLKGKKFSLGSDISNAIKDIKRHQRDLEAFRQNLPEESRNSIMGKEGGIARIYWQALGRNLPSAYTFSKRTRRPAEDFFNAALNYWYGMLYSVVEGGLFAAGLDPYLGILHADEYQKPTLCFDLIEAFRPWIDRLLIQACLEKKLLKSHFTKNQYGYFLNKTGKAVLIPMFNDFMRSDKKFLGRETQVKSHVHFIAMQLAQRIRAFGEN